MSNQTIYAFKVKEAYTIAQAEESRRERNFSPDDDAKYPFWSVNIGKLGWVRDISHDNGGYAEIKILSRDGKGWIPRRCIDQGAPSGVKCTTIAPTFDIPMQIYGQHSQKPLLEKVLTALYRGMSDNQAEFIQAGAASGDIDTLASSDLYAQTLFKGMENINTLRLFKNGPPEWDDLFNLPRVNTSTTGGGIYMILYWITRPSGTRALWWYIGRTNNFGTRFRSHSTQIQSPTEPTSSIGHYSVAQAAWRNGINNGPESGGFRMVKIMQWDINTPPPRIDIHKLLMYTEHTLVCLMGSWNSRLLSGPDSIVDISVAGSYFKAALTFSAFSKRIFAVLGWKLRNVEGLNWSTPLTESAGDIAEQTVWTGVYLPPSRSYEKGSTYMKVFRRSPIRIHRKLRTNNLTYDTLMFWIFTRSKSIEAGVQITIPKEDVIRYDFKRGMTINVVVEIRLDGKPHPTPYARLPAIGPFTDWPNLNTLAIILEWKDDGGGWKSLPIQTSFLYNKPKSNEIGYGTPEAPFLVGPYKKVSAIIAGLMSYQWTSAPARWSFPSVFLRVQDCYFDHYNQAIETSTARPWRMDPIRLLSRAEVERQLDTRYRFINPDRSIARLAMGVAPEQVFSGPGAPQEGSMHRKECDMCQGLHCKNNDITRGLSDKKLDNKCRALRNGESTCERCSPYNRPCTWTSVHLMIARDWTDLIISPRLKIEARDIPAPYREAIAGGEEVDLESDDEDVEGDDEGEDDE